ncbi:hypothetical protein GCM10010435_47160 [Winogradskya consettensis]|uniref:CopC domain-containing protein n=1 Tax=Winogradskya consettensis TaxID=113560 RepID=A0A919SIY8_9ACTN|nr:copper resistance CopC family protein [Actinoplanes consettensis]GIM72815.1 hypothetical protein Aco04nite_32090 [Actinoplanes consettensis]
MKKALAALAAILVVLLPAAPAWAHAQMIASTPAKDATLTTAPTAITLKFTERLNPGFTTIVLSDAARQRIPAAPPAIDSATGTLTLTQPLTNGPYTVAYRVVSVDGHTVQGSYLFTVADPALPAATATVAVAPSGGAAASEPGSGGVPTGALIGLGAAGVALAAIALFLVLSARRRATAQRASRP